jgi:NB-ARC domain/TIR domain/CobQ/CobB/MinD/ParA nucleotide binding domain
LIYTFYSYKGGVGRSMALANLAKWYYLRGLRVIIIDWDLEAPGLENFFYEQNSQLGKVHSRLGLIDMLLAYKRQFPLLPRPFGVQSSDIGGENATELSEPAPAASDEQTIEQILRTYLPPLSSMLYRIEPSSPSKGTDDRALWLLPAGWRSGDRFPAYAQAVQNFDWSEFYTDFEGHAYFEWLREQLETIADVVLIDSRTGVTEMSGICTQHMADVVVSLCVPNIQNLNGIFTMVQSFTRSEVLKARGRSLEVMVVPARIDSSEIEDRNTFEDRFKGLFDNDKFTPAIFRRFQHKLWDLSIPYVPKYAYAEKLVVGDPKGAAELAKAYNDLAVHLVLLAPEDHTLRKRCESDVQLVFGKLTPELQKLLERPPSIFISYSHDDTKASVFEKELRARLEREYSQIIIHSDIHFETGVTWQKQIINTLDSVQAMVVVITRDTLQSQFLRQQWRYARQRGMCLYPLIVPGQEVDFTSLPNWMRKTPLYTYDSPRDWQTLIAQLRSPCQAIAVPFMAPDLPLGFVMRPSEFEQLVHILQGTRRKPTVPVSLCGPGGCGKTVLAAACCHDERVQEFFDEGILWVALGEKPSNLIGKVEDLIYTLSHERPGFTSVDASVARLSELLAERNILLVIDDVWNKADLKPFLQSSKQCARLITTRDAEIAATDRASRIQIEGMTAPEALQMLRAQLDNPPDDQNLLELVTRLSRWPLVLELAGATLRQRIESGDTHDRALRYLNTALDKRGIIAFDQRDAIDRNQALAIAIEESLKQLTPAERERCMQLVTLHEGKDIPLAEVCELWAMSEFDAEEQVEHLHNLSLLKFDLQARTLSLYEVIRDFFTVST